MAQVTRAAAAVVVVAMLIVIKSRSNGAMTQRRFDGDEFRLNAPGLYIALSALIEVRRSP